MPKDSKTPKQQNISMSVIRRLPRYHRYIKSLKDKQIARISSRELSRKMHVTASQIRQDFNCFGEFGLQGYGYNVEFLYAEICRILGLDSGFKTILIGAGHLGRAISTHMNFDDNGFDLIGMFDIREDIIGLEIAGVKINDMDKLEEFCKEHSPKAAILTLPNEPSIKIVERLIELGVKGFWNFAQHDFAADDENIVFENVHLSDSMMTLCYQMGQTEK